MREPKQTTRQPRAAPRPPGNDPIYKRIYAFPEMVEDLLRSLFPKDAIGALDWATLEPFVPERVGDDFRRRADDSSWRVRLPAAGGEWLHVILLLEFQSTSRRDMALRVMEYAAEPSAGEREGPAPRMKDLYRELDRRGEWNAAGRLPQVLPVVLYNGESRWGAARDVAELVEGAPALAAFLPSQRFARQWSLRSKLERAPPGRALTKDMRRWTIWAS